MSVSQVNGCSSLTPAHSSSQGAISALFKQPCTPKTITIVGGRASGRTTLAYSLCQQILALDPLVERVYLFGVEHNIEGRRVMFAPTSSALSNLREHFDMNSRCIVVIDDGALESSEGLRTLYSCAVYGRYLIVVAPPTVLTVGAMASTDMTFISRSCGISSRDRLWKHLFVSDEFPTYADFDAKLSDLETYQFLALQPGQTSQAVSVPKLDICPTQATFKHLYRDPTTNIRERLDLVPIRNRLNRIIDDLIQLRNEINHEAKQLNVIL